MDNFEYDIDDLDNIAHREAEGLMGRIKIKDLENLFKLYQERNSKSDKDYRALYILAVKCNELYKYYFNKYSSNSMRLFDKIAFKVCSICGDLSLETNRYGKT